MWSPVHQLLLQDLFAYAAEVLLLVGLVVLLLHCTLLATQRQYPLVMDYGAGAAAYGLMLVLLVLALELVGAPGPVVYRWGGSLVAGGDLPLLRGLLVLMSLVVLLVSRDYWRRRQLGYFEYHLLLLLSLLGGLWTLAANDFLSLYLSLELQALSCYAMACLRKTAATAEAGLKYFIMGSASSALLLFGISLVLLLTGHQDFQQLQLFLHWGVEGYALPAGLLLITTALLIKLAVAPFHEWLADVYEGVPTPTALFFSTVPKVSAFVVLVRLLDTFGSWRGLQLLLMACCGLSLVLGALNAAGQQQLRRFLAFSSVNHFGFLLLGLVVGTREGVAAAFLYLGFYLVLTFGVWCSLLLMASGGPEVTRFLQLGGLASRNGPLAYGLLLLLLSMGAIPPLAGFNAKVSVLYCLLDHPWGGPLLVVAVASSVLSVYYYIRLVKILLVTSTAEGVGPSAAGHPSPLAAYLVAAAVIFNGFSLLLFL